VDPCNTWLGRVFVGPDVIPCLQRLVEPLLRIVRNEYDGHLAQFYPMACELVNNALISGNPLSLQLMLFWFMDTLPKMQLWAMDMMDGIPVLPPARIPSFFDHLEALTRDLGCNVIDCPTYVHEIFIVIMTGARLGRHALPRPLRGDEWMRRFGAAKNDPDVLLLEDATAKAAAESAVAMLLQTEEGMREFDDGALFTGGAD